MHLYLETFGDFKGQPAAGNTGFGQNGRDRWREAGGLELNWRDVDANDMDVIAYQQLKARRSYCPASEFQDFTRSIEESAQPQRGEGKL